MNYNFNNLNLFYFPLNTIIVDDDKEFLDVIISNIKNVAISAYNSSEEILSNINLIDVQIKNLIEENFAGIHDLNYKNIKNFVNNCESKHGIIISDYQMPDINGIELLSRYIDADLIRILLTNVYTIEEAVDALNKGEINYYLPKDRIHTILNIINELQQKFFNNITRNVLKILDKDSLEFFNNKNYIKIFNDICNRFKINKYYILNSYGSYYLENDVGKYILTIFHKDDLNDIANELSEIDKNKVKKGELIPSYFSEVTGEYKLINAQHNGNYFYSVENFI